MHTLLFFAIISIKTERRSEAMKKHLSIFLSLLLALSSAAVCRTASASDGYENKIVSFDGTHVTVNIDDVDAQLYTVSYDESGALESVELFTFTGNGEQKLDLIEEADKAMLWDEHMRPYDSKTAEQVTGSPSPTVSPTAAPTDAPENVPTPLPVSDEISLDRVNYPLYVGNGSVTDFSNWDGYGSSFTLTATVSAPDYSSGDIEWNVENEDIANIVSIDGASAVIRGRRTGVTTVTASLPNGESAGCAVTVIDNASRLTVETLSFNTDRLTLIPGGSAELIPITYPKDIYGLGMLNDKLLWTSSDTSVATVENGVITAQKNGTAVITAESADVGRTAECVVTVADIPAEPVTAASGVIDMTVGDHTALSAECGGEIIWSSDNSMIADIDENGTVYAASNTNVQNVSEDGLTVTEIPGTVKVYATSVNGGDVAVYELRIADSDITDEYLIPSDGVFGEQEYVPSKQTTAISISAKDIDIDEVYQIVPEADGDSRLIWLSSSMNTATVDREGNIKGYKPGKVTIFAVSADSLTDEETEALETLSEERELGESAILEALPNNAVYAQFTVTVKDSSPYLRNTHVVPEAVTYNSANVLWNRDALNNIPEFAEYKVYLNGTETDAVTTLGYTFEDLEPETEYIARIAAVDTDGAEVVSETVTFTTKPAPTAVINVLDYGAKGDGTTLDTFAIQSAINDCPDGGMVYLPSGCVFRSGALFLKSDMTFMVDGVLLGSIDPKDYPRQVTLWEGWRKTEQTADEWDNTTEILPENHTPHASLINAGKYDEGVWGMTGPYNVENLVICGSGQINANGFMLAFNEGPNATYSTEPWTSYDYPVKDQSQRGRAITIHNGRNIYIKDVTVAYSPSWTVHTIFCDHITFDNMEVVTQGNGNAGKGTALKTCGHIPNGDGIDPESCTNVNIFNTRFTTGDDAVAIKAGRNKEGNMRDKPNMHMRVTDCESVWSLGGFGTGSENAGGSRDILFQNLRADNVRFYGVWIKTRPERGGISRDIQIKDMNVRVANAAVSLTHEYGDNANPGNKVNPADKKPVLKYVTIENVTSEGNSNGIPCNGIDGSLISNVTIKNCSFKQNVPSKLQYCSDFEIIDVENTSWSVSRSQNINIRFTRIEEDTAVIKSGDSFWIESITDGVITAIENVTANMLLNEITSSEGGEQTYTFDENVTDYDAPLMSGTVLTVTSPDGLHTREYVIELKQGDITQLKITDAGGNTLMNTALFPDSAIEELRTSASEVAFEVTNNDPSAVITVTVNGEQVYDTAAISGGENPVEITVESFGTVKRYTFNIDASWLYAEDFTSVTDSWGFEGSGGVAASDGTLRLLTSKKTGDNVTKTLDEITAAKSSVEVCFDWRSNAASNKGNGSWFALHDSDGNMIFAIYGNGKYVGIGASTTDTGGGWETIESFSNDTYRVELTLDFTAQTINGTITNITDNKIVKTYIDEPMANGAANLGAFYAEDGYSDAVITLDNVYVK